MCNPALKFPYLHVYLTYWYTVCCKYVKNYNIAYLFDYIRFKGLWVKVIRKNQDMRDRVSTGLEMALNQIFAKCYVFDRQYDEDNGELGSLVAITLLSKLHKPDC